VGTELGKCFLAAMKKGGNGSRLVPVSASEVGAAENFL